MFKDNPFEFFSQTMTEGAGTFDPKVMQVIVRSSSDNLKAWVDLVQSQVLTAQTVAAHNFEAFNGIRTPQVAFETMKVSAEQGVAIATQNLKEVTALAVARFKANIEAIEKVHPAPEAFSSVAKGLKDAAATLETTLDSAMKNSATAAGVVTDTSAKASSGKPR